MSFGHHAEPFGLSETLEKSGESSRDGWQEPCATDEAGGLMRVSLIVSAGLFAAVIAAASPALAQRHGGERSGRAVARGDGHASAPRSGPVAPRSAPVVPQARGIAPRAIPSAPRGGVTPRTYSLDRRGVAVPRGYSGNDGRAYSRGYGNGGRVYARGYYGYGRPVVRVAPVRFYRPYYVFRPRVSLGFGLWVGFPVAYSYAYYDPFYYGYPYPYSYPYPYDPYGVGAYPAYPAAPPYPTAPGYPTAPYPAYPPAQGSVGVQPGVQPSPSDTGGLSFEITPSTAQVFADGTLVGTVGQFTPTSQPLGLAAGRHHVEIRAPGYEPMSFDVDIVAGQVIPYQGTMER